MTTTTELKWPGLHRERRAIVVVDVVESVRLMQAHEADVIDRWRRFVNEVATQVLPVHAGRLVKSLGDGLMLEFADVPPAVQASIAMQQRIAAYSAGYSDDRAMGLRVGVHVADVVVDELDVYGVGVNLAARLATLAGPGEIVVSSDIRDGLVAGLDADVEDLGECFVKHLSAPIRGYRVGPVGQRPVVPAAHKAEGKGLPTLAVVPFEARDDVSAHAAIGDLIADGVIAQLSRSRLINVISRLSTAPFRKRSASAAEIETHLGATFVLSGAHHMVSERLVVTVELSNARTNLVAWSDRMVVPLADLFEPESELIARIASAVHDAVLAQEVTLCRTRPMPTLDSASLLIGAVTMMHRATRDDFERVRGLLEHLIDRNPRLPVPRAWLAHWYVLRVTRGWSHAPGDESKLALDQTRRALDADSECSLALAVEGFVHCHMLKDLEAAAERYRRSLDVNPNESIGWLFMSVLHAFKAEGSEAMAAAEQALRLSPLDPMRYFYDSLASTAALSAGRYDRAIELAGRSLRANRTHSSTLRALAIAQSRLGRIDDARRTVADLLRLEPTLTVRSYLERSPIAAYPTGREWSEALALAGLPR